VRPLIRELLAFLEVADTEFKLAMTSQICIAADRYAPNKRWHVDTVLRVLKLAGGYVREEILSSFIRLVGLTPELQMYVTQKLYASLKEDITQEGLTIAGVWCIGEYGELLLKGGNYEEEELVREVNVPDKRGAHSRLKKMILWTFWIRFVRLFTLPLLFQNIYSTRS
jgi:AP-1 complex subunit gamma-1